MKYTFDPKHVKSWAQEGQNAGEFARNQFSEAESSVMAMLLAVATVIAGTPSQEDFLTGYAKAWTNADTAKSRKADARLVFDAFSAKGEGDKPYQHAVVQGYERDENSTREDKAKLDAAGNPVLIVETKSAQDWLKEYTGDWKGFLTLCRDIRNKASGRASQGTTTAPTRRKNVTDKQFATIMQDIPVMSANQAHATVVEATKQIAKLPNFENAVLAEIEMLCNTLKTSKQPIFVNAASAMFDILNDLREEVRKAAEMSEQAKKNLAGTSAASDIQPPAPAIQQQKAA